jgi:hypothetical protein
MLELITSQIVASDGLSVNFKDITGATSSTAYGIGGNDTYTDIVAVRIKVGTATTIQSTSTLNAGDAFIQFTEYIKTSGASSTVDGKTCVVGTVIVPQLTTLTVPSGDVWETSGYCVPQIISTWTPTATEVALNLDINELGQSGTYVEDNVYVFNYDVFDTSSTGTNAAVSGSSYLVMTGTLTYNGNTYRAGEYFTAVNTGNIVAGSSTYAILYATTTSYALLIYTLTTSIFANINEKGTTGNEAYFLDIYKIKSQVDALSFACATLNVDFAVCTELIAMLQNQVIYLDSNSL